MRSTWSADRWLLLLAVVSFEAAWLTLGYLALLWLAAIGQPRLGIAHMAAAVMAGLLLGRALHRRRRPVYAAALMVAAFMAAGVGIWLAAAPRLAPADLSAALSTNSAGWLAGVGLLRGSQHADLDPDAGRVERALDVGLIGLGAFWIFASASGLSGAEPFGGPAFAATLTFVSAALLSLGLARLAELRVEGADRAARWRWLIMLVAVSGVVLLIGVPLAALLGLPVSEALAGIAGPLAPVLLVLLVLLALPAGLLLELLQRLLPPSTGAPLPVPSPTLGPGGTPGGAGGTPWILPDLSWLAWPILAAVAGLVMLGIASLLHRPVMDDRPDAGAEVREAEPIGDGLRPHLPRLRRFPRPRRRAVPRTAREAYLLALELLVGRDEQRRVGETPREHAQRVRSTALGGDLGRLAADVQLTDFAGRSLSATEERRALDRYRRLERAARSAPAPRGSDPSG